MLEIVAEKTGYPKDMLDLDLDLEADLGVDTVKQAEMFAAVRAAYNIPRDENLKLRDFPTLAHVIQFVYEKRPDLAGGSSRCSRLDRRKPAALPAASRGDRARTRPRMKPIKEKVWRSSPRRQAIRRTCSTSILISKPISASTPSSRRRCSPRYAPPTTFRATKT